MLVVVSLLVVVEPELLGVLPALPAVPAPMDCVLLSLELDGAVLPPLPDGALLVLLPLLDGVLVLPLPPPLLDGAAPVLLPVLEDGVLPALVPALPLPLPEVWPTARPTPPAKAAAVARVVRYFLVLFISLLLMEAPTADVRCRKEGWKKNAGGCQLFSP